MSPASPDTQPGKRRDKMSEKPPPTKRKAKGKKGSEAISVARPKVRPMLTRDVRIQTNPNRAGPTRSANRTMPTVDDEGGAWTENFEALDLMGLPPDSFMRIAIHREEMLPTVGTTDAYKRAMAAEKAAQGESVQRGANPKLDAVLDHLARYGLDRLTLLEASYVPVHLLRYVQGAAKKFEEGWPKTRLLARQYRGLKRMLE